MALNFKDRMFDGPIPGENYTSDTKNYPWHRPPEFTDLDEAIDYIAKQVFNEDSVTSTLTMIEMGMTVAQLTQMILMTGVSKGKWTVDYALLLAGPTSHILCLLCKAYDVKYEMGIDKKKVPMTKAFFKAVQEGRKKTLEPSVQEGIVEEVKEASSEEPEEMETEGFMPKRGAV